MTSEQNLYYFTFNKIFYTALRTLSHKYQQDSLQIEYMEDNKFRVHGWTDDDPSCIKLLENVNRTVEKLNVIKLTQPEKKIERMRVMKKWRKKFEIEGLNIITIAKNYGSVHYLMGLASHEHLYNVFTSIQAHSYKTFSSNFIKFLYKPVFEALVNSKDYQIAIFEKLKVTATELRIVELENANKKRGKFVEFLFEIKEYAPTKTLVEKFKQFLINEYFVCGLIFGTNQYESIKKALFDICGNGKITAWKVVVRKKENVLCASIVLKNFQALERISEILAAVTPERICFWKGLGKQNEFLQPILYVKSSPITQRHEELMKSYNVKGNRAKTPNEISLTIKDGEPINWIPAFSILI